MGVSKWLKNQLPRNRGYQIAKKSTSKKLWKIEIAKNQPLLKWGYRWGLPPPVMTTAELHLLGPRLDIWALVLTIATSHF